jgi:hypothetical protein
MFLFTIYFRPWKVGCGKSTWGLPHLPLDLQRLVGVEKGKEQREVDPFHRNIIAIHSSRRKKVLDFVFWLSRGHLQPGIILLSILGFSGAAQGKANIEINEFTPRSAGESHDTLMQATTLHKIGLNTPLNFVS